MSPERWRKVEALYEAALKVEPAQRPAFLEENCAGDESLRHEVESLLFHHENAGRFLQGPTPAEQLEAGQCVSHYEIIGKLGEGGMGLVYKARDSRLRRFVALKVLPPEMVADAERKQRFVQEARSASALNHPNIVTVHDIDQSDGIDFIAMEYVEGKTLDELIGRKGLKLKEALKYAIQIADALAKAHAAGIVHRDVKPGNVMVTAEGRVKVLDFGVAKLTEAAPASHGDATQTQQPATESGLIVGTVSYMSPEQAEGKKVDTRSDIFSFGSLLYEMVTGRRAFRRDSPALTLVAIISQEPAPLAVDTPHDLEKVITRCLRKDPARRIQHMDDVKLALEDLKEDSDSGKLAGIPATGRKRPWRWLWAAAAGAVLLLAAVLVFRQPPAEARPYRLQIDPPEGSRFTFGTSLGGLALSPDGRTAAFVASGSGKNGLWVQPLDGVTARLIAGTEGAAKPFWSPDSKSIAFFSGGKLRRVDLAAGEAPGVICDAAMPRGGAWSSDGRILFGRDIQPFGLFQVSESGGTPKPLTKADASRGEGNHSWPQVLPGGRFLYLIRSENPETSGIYVASFAKPRERTLLLTTDTNALYAPGGDGRSYLLWLRGGTLVAQQLDIGTLKLEGEPHTVADPVARIGLLGQMNVSVSAGGLLLYSASNTLSQFTMLDRTGKLLRVVGEPGEYGSFRLSPDGSRIATSLDRHGSNDLWLLEVERGVRSRLTVNSNGFPIWSPDGRTILYSSGSPANLFRKESSGAGEEQRFSRSPNGQLPTDWSGEGRWLLYYEINPDTQRDLWVLPTTSDGKPAPGATPIPYLRTPYNERWGRFSPEAHPQWVAYDSDETGRWEVYIQAFPEPRGAKRISTDGGQYPQWGAGGRELFYVSPDYKLMVVSLKLGRHTVEPSRPRELFPLSAVEMGWSPYDITPDGLSFLVRAMPVQAAQPLTVIVNWPALLKKEAPAP